MFSALGSFCTSFGFGLMKLANLQAEKERKKTVCGQPLFLVGLLFLGGQIACNGGKFNIPLIFVITVPFF